MNSRPLRVLFVSSEVAPFSKTGGLADVSAALPRALAAAGCEMRVLSPRYGFVDAERHGLQREDAAHEFTVDLRGRTLRCGLSAAPPSGNGPQVFFVECDPLYDRPGIYVDPFTNRDYIDNDYRFIVLCRAALAFGEVHGWTPDLLHCNDWQTGLIPLYLARHRERGEWQSTRSLLTIHNIAYHGLFGPDTVGRVGGAETYFYPGGPIEFYGQVNFLKAGLEFADALNTVSPTYAREIQSSYESSYGLDAVLRARDGRLAGVLNGIDEELWNPAADPRIVSTYTADTLDRKEHNKRALCDRMGFPYRSSDMVIGIVSRIVTQKGFEILVPALGDLLNLPVRMALLGSGEPHFEHVLRQFARIYPERFAARIGYDESLAHLIEAGSDVFLMPSKYEPCGLNQMMSMRYGTLPVVRATGGLADTVTDADEDPLQGTGFSFPGYRPEELLHAVRRAHEAFQDRRRWRRLQANAMSQDFSWARSARRYVELYRQCLAAPPRSL
jgi:starch synthase